MPVRRIPASMSTRSGRVIPAAAAAFDSVSTRAGVSMRAAALTALYFCLRLRKRAIFAPVSG